MSVTDGIGKYNRADTNSYASLISSQVYVLLFSPVLWVVYFLSERAVSIFPSDIQERMTFLEKHFQVIFFF